MEQIVSVRPTRAPAASQLQATLTAGTPAAEGGLPELLLVLADAAAQAGLVTVKLHNRAGIPIIEGQGHLVAGQRELQLAELHPLGIEGYAHVSPAERANVARRVWSRVSYATIVLHKDPAAREDL